MDTEQASEILKKVHKQSNFSFAKNTTYGCGGTAKVAYFPETTEQSIAVFSYLKEQNIRYVILGNGSDILASDVHFDGAVISTKKLSGIERISRNSIFCLAGTTVGALLRYCVINGLGGLEYLAGIPATVGGLVYMNAGAGGKYISSNVVNVQLYDGELHYFSNKCCRFGNKYSTMRDINCLILGVELSFTPQNGKIVSENIKQRLADRARLPKGKSCGCVFKNPQGISAGKLIDECGLKGLSVGGATVSEQHANFIINNGANPEDIRILIKEVKRRVREHTGIELEEEVVYIGDF